MLTLGLAGGTAVAAVRLQALARRSSWQTVRLATLRWWGLALVAVAVQSWLIFAASSTLAPAIRAGAVWGSQVAILAVALANLRRPWLGGMAAVVAGLGLNLLVMAANGGLMPVSPQTLVRSGNGHVLQRLGVGDQLPRSKDVILAEEQTNLLPLSDQLVIPGKRGSFSAGDVVIAVGVFVVLQSAVTAAWDGSRT